MAKLKDTTINGILTLSDKDNQPNLKVGKTEFKLYSTYGGTYDLSAFLNLSVANSTYVRKSGDKMTGALQAPSFNATSDRRLKENIVDYTPKKSILDLPIKEFDYKNSNIHTIGCIAQDLQEICPEIVNEGEDGYLSIQESKLIYLLLDEVKKLKKEVEELKKKQ